MLRRLCIALIVVLAARPVAAGIDRWTPFGPTGGAVDALAIDPRAADTWWMVSAGHLYRSPDGGASWQVKGSGLAGRSVRFLAIDPGDPDVMYATASGPGVTEAGVFRSDDAGESWRLMATAVDLAFLDAFTVAPGRPGEPGVIFAGTAARVLSSRDGGATFQPAPSSVGGTFITPDLRNPGTVYAGTLEQRWKSTDFGATWQAIEENPGGERPSLDTLAVAPGDSRTLYASGDSTWRSEDGGATWEGPFPTGGDRLAVDPVDAETLYIGKEWAGLFVSHDGGATSTAATDVPQLDGELTAYSGVRSIVVDSSRPGFAVAGTGKGLFATSDGGEHWRAPAQRGVFNNRIEGVRIDPWDPAHWLLRSQGECKVSRDGGRTFEVQTVPAAQRIDAVEFDPFVRDRMWAMTILAGEAGFEPALFVSDDRGATWGRVGGEIPGAGPILLVPARRVLLTAGNDGILRSRDAGRSWTRVLASLVGDPDDNTTLVFQRLLADPRNAHTLYALGLLEVHPHGGSSPVIYRSDDFGRTWRLWRRGEAVAFHPLRPRTVYIVQGSTLLIATEGSPNFQPVGDLGLPPYAVVTDLIFDRAHPRTLYAATSGEGVLRSRDGGHSWEPVSAGLPADSLGNVTAIWQDPLSPRRFYATPASGGLYRADFTLR